MTVKELREILNNCKDEDKIKFYVWDYEYDEEDPEEVGIAKFKSANGLYLNLGLHC
ncbi:hypothetical protein [Clostridium estertheticum]|uniref:hypothetical protein n=1 Tax=Clostridium estertheticum TaxID=238834 RepID=UPI001C0B6015|nr:hypothetical protein [Clostridium estertheticum]MBU3186563.1 hypothetical protein [Clostridium estertheticum]